MATLEIRCSVAGNVRWLENPQKKYSQLQHSRFNAKKPLTSFVDYVCKRKNIGAWEFLLFAFRTACSTTYTNTTWRPNHAGHSHFEVRSIITVFDTMQR